MLKKLLRRLSPRFLISLYHNLLARIAAFVYRNPSEKMVVIGVTGTNGKSTTVEFIGRILEGAGNKVGWTSTAGFKIGKKEWVNDQKMTMLGRFQTQKMLKQMLKAGCTHAIIETSSQGILQSRHIGINYDVAVLTNLTPEHIEAHGGFEAYKKAKQVLFKKTKHSKRKKFKGEVLEKVAVVNINDEHGEDFLSIGLDRSYGFGIDGKVKAGEKVRPMSVVPVLVNDVKFESTGTKFGLNGKEWKLNLIGGFYLEDALAAIAVCSALQIDEKVIKKSVQGLKAVPGRLELIENKLDVTVIVDYAYEPYALKALYNAVKLIEHKRVIHVVGSAGGGRDVARRAILGKMSAKMDDVVIVANEDPYDEDPMQIINDVADAAKKAGKKDGEDLFRILDRQEAIDSAIEMAKKGDLVLITGKGSEPVMAVANGKKAKWDDRKAARKSINKYAN
jgi:UDP-N-acetylmuramoyl-L-alanyl-D-glutamate--2,6-diaminopimelate ligase